ncbi:MAG TPA: phosphatase PAP2 family protein [Methylomirabilota bacterium]|jgi:undecaprenyl-diphosphatase|nr:phosphatase PAP2 family protein [Methylomirabilota bacterium]
MIIPRSRAVLLVAGAAFLALAGAVALLGTLPMDAAIRDALLAWATPPVLTVMRVVNYAGDWRVILPGTLLLFVVFTRARARWWIWLGLMVAAPIAQWMLKEAIGRPRPENASLGFPSGHATAAAAFFGAVVYLAGALPSRRACLVVRGLALGAVVLVAAARVMLRAHWPSDVLAGIALGLALAAGAALAATPLSDEG